jgi:DNA invertase Pin-like site-specific DNA recombinase
VHRRQTGDHRVAFGPGTRFKRFQCRAGHVERIDADHWKIPDDIAERGIGYDAPNRPKDFGIRTLSTLDLHRQVGSDGATWLDRELVARDHQRRQGEAYCASRGYHLVETFVEPGASAANDRRPEFQHMIEAGTSKPAPFDVVVVHSFSRFFRDAFDMEFYVRKLAKNGVKLLSITKEMGDDPVHQMMRQIMALFDEYQSKENAKRVLRALKENARQGFWNGSLPPIGYRRDHLRARPACRGRRERGSHHGTEVPAASGGCGGKWRKLSAHSGTELAGHDRR